jgi:hypothetical protein
LALTAAPVGAVFTEQHKGIRKWHLLLYVAWCVFLIVLTVCINRGKKNRSNDCHVRYAYDGATKMVGRLTFVAAVLFVAIFAWVGFSGRLPNQQLPIRISHGAPVDKPSCSDVAGFELFVPLVEAHFPNGIPKTFQLIADCDKSISMQWKVAQAYIYPVTSGSVDTELGQRGPVFDRGNGSFAIVFDTLTGAARYRVRLILTARDDEGDLIRVSQESDPTKKKDLLETLIPEYRKRARAALDRLLIEGGVTISLM